MFAGWENFYLMIGSAAGALIGLLFVVETLTGGMGADKAELGARVYLTPTVSHFAVILAVSVVTAAPRLSSWVVAALLIAAGVWGLVYSANVSIMLHRRQGPSAPHWTDFWCYGCVPGVFYLGQIAAAVALGMGVFWGQNALAAALLALLLLTIRNAWDLVVAIAPIANSKP
jgi:hypothetical protein